MRRIRDWKERFWEKVDKRGPDDCWEWNGSRTRGYGYFTIRKKATRAHRLSFFLEHGHWPQPECLHSCDNPACQNPRHLWEGTQLDNIRDACQKGRIHRTRAISDTEKTEFAQLLHEWRGTKSYAEAAKHFGVSMDAYRMWELGMRKPWSFRLVLNDPAKRRIFLDNLIEKLSKSAMVK